MSLLKPIALVTTLAVFSPLPVWAQRAPKARLLPVPASEWTEAHREALGARARGDDTLDVFQTCLRNLELCRNWRAFTNSLDPPDGLPVPIGLRMGTARGPRPAHRPDERGAHAHHARTGCRRLDACRRHAPPCRRRAPSRPAHQRHHLDASAGALR